jgi:hypothetical protein
MLTRVIVAAASVVGALIPLGVSFRFVYPREHQISANALVLTFIATVVAAVVCAFGFADIATNALMMH